MINGRRERDVMFGLGAAMSNSSCVSAASGIPVATVLPLYELTGLCVSNMSTSADKKNKPKQNKTKKSN